MLKSRLDCYVYYVPVLLRICINFFGSQTKKEKTKKYKILYSLVFKNLVSVVIKYYLLIARLLCQMKAKKNAKLVWHL